MQSHIDAVGFAVAENTVLIADGGVATELEARSHDPLWPARLPLDQATVTGKPVLAQPNNSSRRS